MNKLFLTALFLALIVSCGHSSKKSTDNTTPDNENIVSISSVDTLALILDALRNKRLPDGYRSTGDLRSGILTYTGFRMEDAGNYVFTNESGDEISFSGNDTHLHLTVKSANPTQDNGGNDPNPVYLNRKFRIVWRRIQLDHKPQNETELYYQEYDQIIYLKEMK